MKIDDVIERVRDRFARDRPLQAITIQATSILDEITRLAIEEVGFHVSESGEVCDPRPRPSSVPEQRNARWGGGRRRR